MPVTVRRLLIESKSVIADPEKWTREAYARDAKGSITLVSDPGAVSFCSSGIVHRKARELDVDADTAYKAFRILDEAAKVFGMDLTKFNDTFPHTIVMALWERVIAKAE